MKRRFGADIKAFGYRSDIQHVLIWSIKCPLFELMRPEILGLT